MEDGLCVEFMRTSYVLAIVAVCIPTLQYLVCISTSRHEKLAIHAYDFNVVSVT